MFKKTLTIIALLLLAMAVIMPVNASQLQNVSDTMSRLKKSMEGYPVLSDHTIQFATPSGVGVNKTIVITFPIGFNMGTVDYTDIDLKDDGVNLDLATATSTGVWGVAVSGQVITFTNGNTAVATNSVIEIKIGINTNYQIAGNAQITNPTIAGTQMININGTFGDTTTLAVVILDDDQVVVTASVVSILSFAIAPLATSTLLGGTGTNSDLTDSVKMASSTALAFGDQMINDGTILGQQITVTTNAGSGYQVTLQQNQNLTASANTINNFIASNAVPQKWENDTNPDGTEQNVNSGWFGYTTSDTTLSGTLTGRFGTGNEIATHWAGFTGNNTPYEIAYNNASIINGESTNIGFKLEVNAYQPTGYYSGTVLTYICTAVY